MKKVMAVLVAFVAAIAFSVQTVQASPSLQTSYVCGVYGEVDVVGGSNGKVVAKEGGKADLNLWEYQGSCVTYRYPDVDYFWVPGGCDAKNVNTGYTYVGNRTYGPLPTKAFIALRVTC